MEHITSSFSELIWTGLMPRSMCLQFNPVLIGLYALFQITIGICYYRIPLKAFLVASRKGLKFNGVAKDFGWFIFWCGTKHFADALIIFIGMFYYVEIFLIMPLMAWYSVKANIRFQQLLPNLINKTETPKRVISKIRLAIAHDKELNLGLQKALIEAEKVLSEMRPTSLVK